MGSFYGEVVNFYDFKENRPHKIVVAIDEFAHPHTAIRLQEKFKEGHTTIGIIPEQINLIWTDNASNMMAATFLPDDATSAEDDQSLDGDSQFEVFVVSLNEGDEEDDLIQRHFGDPIHTKNLVSKMCTDNRKFKTSSNVIESARKLVKTINGSPTLKQDWSNVCQYVLIGDVQTRFDSTFLMTQRLCNTEVVEQLPRFIARHTDAISTNLLPGSYQWKELEALNSLLKPFHQCTLLLSGDAWTLSLLYPLIHLLLNRHLSTESQPSASFPRLAQAMLKDLTRRFKWLQEKTYFKLITFLDPSLAILFNGPPFSDDIPSMKEAFVKGYLNWKDTCSGIREMDQIDTATLTLEDDDVLETDHQTEPQLAQSSSTLSWSDFYVERSDTDEEEESQSLSQSQPILLSQEYVREDLKAKLKKQFDIYHSQIPTYNSVTPSFQIDLKKHAEYLHSFWLGQATLSPELSQFALANECFSGSGTGVERLFSGAAIQAEGRLRVISNEALRERTLIASNRDLL